MNTQSEDMVLLGYHHFSSKDKKEIYYVVQCLHNDKDITKGTNKATMINIFTDDEIYKKVTQLDIGSVLKVEITPNLSSGKLYYKVVI